MTTALLSIKAAEHPIIFSGAMVRAILEGRKSQTRRVCKPTATMSNESRSRGPCPYGKPGQQLWVREGWRWFGRILRPGEVQGGFEYRADLKQRKFEEFPDPDFAWDEFRGAAIHEGYHWRPSIHLPRWASRITLEISSVRVERLNDISTDDAIAEGINGVEYCPTRQHKACRFEPDWHFRNLWDSINGKKHPWASNPWVWAISFKRV